MSRHPFVPRSTPSRAGGRRFVRRLIMVMALVAVALAAAAGVAGAGQRSHAATPKRGGTLKLLGTSDIFNLDTVSAYYTVSTLIGRTFTRQLLTYQSVPDFTQAIKLVPDVATEVPTAGNGISADGKTYTFKLRDGVMWDTTPPREVTAADFVREFKMLCNPASPVGAPGYYTSTILGMQAYCDGFAKVKPTVAAINGYVKGHQLAGVLAPDPKTVVFKLSKSAPDFLEHHRHAVQLAAAGRVRAVRARQRADAPAHDLGRPVQDHLVRADEVVQLARNPAWKQASDPVRHAWVDAIQVTEGLTAQSVQQQIEAGTGDMEWDLPGPPAQDLPRLIAANDKRLVIGPSGPYDVALYYYLALNQFKGPMKNKLVRQAVATAVNKQAIVQLTGGPRLSTVSNQMVLPGNVGYVKNFNAYPANKGTGNAAAAKALLAKAGYPNGLAIKFIASTNDPAPRLAQAIQASLNAGGFKVKIVPVDPVGLLRQVHVRAEQREAGSLGYCAAGLDPGLVRQQRPLDAPAAVHRTRARLERLRRLRQPRRPTG